MIFNLRSFLVDCVFFAIWKVAMNSSNFSKLTGLLSVCILLYSTDAPAPPAVPASPSNLIATAVSSTQINLTWTDNSSDETGFKIESPVGTQITLTAANATSYNHTGLTCNTVYSYAVKATNANGDSGSITANATTSACAINAPINLNFNKQLETFATEIDLK